MERGLKILKSIYSEMGSEIDSLVRDYPRKTFISEYEGQFIVDPRFKQLVEIISSNYFIPYKDTLIVSNVRLISRSLETNLGFIDCALRFGNIPYVLRADLLLFALRRFSQNSNKPASELLRSVISKKKFYEVEKSWVRRIKYYLNQTSNRDKVTVGSMDVILLSIVTGKTRNDIVSTINKTYKEDLNTGEMNV